MVATSDARIPFGHERFPIRAVKRRFPHVTTIWEAISPNNYADVVMGDSAVGYVVRSQGELTILGATRLRTGGFSMASWANHREGTKDEDCTR